MSSPGNDAIGIFDSGIGGLTVFKEIRKKLPHETIIYLGDTARVPYGIRSAQTVLKYSITNTEFLVKQRIKLLVIACNTASAVATGALRQRYPMPIVDVIGPGARGAVVATRNKHIGIIGTEGTIRSGAYQQEVLRLDGSARIFTAPCPLFVPMAEEGWCNSDDEVVTMVARRYLYPLKEHEIDTLVLGCTHYPLLKGALQTVMGAETILIDSAEETACMVEQTLKNNHLLKSDAAAPGESVFYLTDIPFRFTETGKRFLGDELSNVTVVDV